MASGVTDRLWEVSDLVGLWEAEERGWKERRKRRSSRNAKITAW
jgi:hypothetical protein